MESENGRTPVDASQDEENINSVASASSSDDHEDISQQSCEQPSSATSASSGKASCSEKPTQIKETSDGMCYNLEYHNT